MACSDNVVRVGLTPKFRDVNTLVNMLTYRCEKKHLQNISFLCPLQLLISRSSGLAYPQRCWIPDFLWSLCLV